MAKAKPKNISKAKPKSVPKGKGSSKQMPMDKKSMGKNMKSCAGGNA